MGSYLPPKTNEPAEEFDSVLSYLSAVSQNLSRVELLDIADTLHELVRRRRGESRSWASIANDRRQKARLVPSPHRHEKKQLFPARNLSVANPAQRRVEGAAN